ncbi:uncharacterized protein LOC128203171 [Mya arenaria]|uniref:uncharacterized protein LOC128203171 n=1 Tax=Mya arenaria TaxID=6604 RepID=UPI0022DEC862|nr:uncharacterized protein LOC128203171 [Mya arenaria]
MMAGRLKLIKLLKHARKLCKVTAAPAVMFGTVAVGFKRNTWNADKKDSIVFLSKEENAKPSKVQIKMTKNGENREDPVLPNGDYNWSCKCIEHDVVGPCNISFRPLAKFMHDNKIKETLNVLPQELRGQFDSLMDDYLSCTMDHPKYYVNLLSLEELEDIRDEKIAEQQKLKDRELHTQRFGKDTVFFISKEENKIPCKVVIPKGEDLEEFREPLNPDGTVNWACGCIERDVVGPCNSEFRVFRQLIHDTKGYKDDMPMEKQMELHTIIKSYFDCMNEHPIYYAATLKRTTEGDDSEDVDVKADNNNDTDSKGEVSP